MEYDCLLILKGYYLMPVSYHNLDQIPKHILLFVKGNGWLVGYRITLLLFPDWGMPYFPSTPPHPLWRSYANCSPFTNRKI